jgi:hypothetical protein
MAKRQTGTALAAAADAALEGAADEEAQSVPALESVRLPTEMLLAALSCAASGKTKQSNALHGVNVRAVSKTEVRIAATDGHRAFIYAMPAQDPPEWLTQGVTLPVELLADRVKLIEKFETGIAALAYQTGAAHAVLADPRELAVFRMFPVQDEFPDFEPILGKLKLGARQLVDLDSVTYAPAYLKAASSLATMLGAKHIRVYGTATSEGDPSLFTFPGCPGAILLIMPMTPPQPMIEAQTARMLDSAIAGTVSALRAHRTRWARKLDSAASERAKKTIQSKLDDYDRRIAAILGQTAPALPAPQQHFDESEDDEVEGGFFDPHAPEAPIKSKIASESETQAAWAAGSLAQATGRDQTQRADDRGKLKGRAASKALDKFCADVNAVLSRDHGLTLSRLADGVPVEHWFAPGGLSPEEAALRCLQWRQPEAEPPEAVSVLDIAAK